MTLEADSGNTDQNCWGNMSDCRSETFKVARELALTDEVHPERALLALLLTQQRNAIKDGCSHQNGGRVLPAYNTPAYHRALQAIESVQAYLGTEQTSCGQDAIGLGLMHMAGHEGNQHGLQLLLDLGQRVDEPSCSGGYTPMHAACLGSMSSDCIETLTRWGANLNALDGDGLAPIHYLMQTFAYVQGKKDDDAYGNVVLCVRALIQGGADVTLKDKAGKTPSEQLTSPRQNAKLTEWRHTIRDMLLKAEETQTRAKNERSGVKRSRV